MFCPFNFRSLFLKSFVFFPTHCHRWNANRRWHYPVSIDEPTSEGTQLIPMGQTETPYKYIYNFLFSLKTNYCIPILSLISFISRSFGITACPVGAIFGLPEPLRRSLLLFLLPVGMPKIYLVLKHRWQNTPPDQLEKTTTMNKFANSSDNVTQNMSERVVLAFDQSTQTSTKPGVAE